MGRQGTWAKDGQLREPAPPAKVEPQGGVLAVAVGREGSAGALHLHLPTALGEIGSGHVGKAVHGLNHPDEAVPRGIDIIAGHEVGGLLTDAERNGVEGQVEGVLVGWWVQCLG